MKLLLFSLTIQLAFLLLKTCSGIIKEHWYSARRNWFQYNVLNTKTTVSVGSLKTEVLTGSKVGL